MKFKDIVISIFLAGLLTYAACHRANLVGNDKAENCAAVAFGGACLDGVSWMNTVHFNNLVFSVHPEAGLTVNSSTGEKRFSAPVKADSIHIVSDWVVNGDTLNLLYCKNTKENSFPCFKILEDGRLEAISTQNQL